MRIDELFNNPLNWQWVVNSPTHFKAEFKTDNIGYVVDIGYIDPEKELPDLKDSDKNRDEFPYVYEPFWGITFAANIAGKKNYDITGTGDSVHVFSTVLTIVKEFMSHYPKAILYFSASEPSRAKLYIKLVKLLGNNYEVHDNFGEKHFFVFT